MRKMNHYGRLGHDHWAEWLPTRFNQIENPETFFTGLGLEVAREIEAIMDATTIPPEVPIDKVSGRWATAKRNAENQILSELVFLPPEEGLDEVEIDRTDAPDGAGWWLEMRRQEQAELQAESAEQEYQDQLAWDAELAEKGLNPPQP